MEDNPIIFQQIWSVPKYLPYVQPALTDEIIKEAESKIGYKLPADYLELLKVQNGGYIRYHLGNMLHSVIAGIGPHYPSITKFEWLEEFDDLSFEVKGLFPFDGDGHWNICLDYREHELEPQVTYIDTESDYQRLIANSFSAYLDKLIINTDDYFVIETTETIENISNKISQIANIEFVKSDTFNHGYSVYSSKYKESYVWLSANKVPAGFIRPNDVRYESLKSRMDNLACRYPEAPENSVLISVSEEVDRDALFKKLKEKGFVIKDLKNYV